VLEKQVEELVQKEFGAIDGQNLFKNLASIEVVMLVTKVEKAFGIAIEPIEVDDNTFGSVAKLSELVGAKLAAAKR
jgi:acyl carrier protein